jgi:hypothetical protein
MNKRLIPWIRKHLPKLAIVGSVAALAGCATAPTSTTSAANSINAAPVGQITYAGTCIGYNTSLAVLSIARANGKLTPSQVQTINDAATVFDQYCPPNSLPANPTAAMLSIAQAVNNINAIQKVVSPSTPLLK